MASPLPPPLLMVQPLKKNFFCGFPLSLSRFRIFLISYIQTDSHSILQNSFASKNLFAFVAQLKVSFLCVCVENFFFPWPKFFLLATTCFFFCCSSRQGRVPKLRTPFDPSSDIYLSSKSLNFGTGKIILQQLRIGCQFLKYSASRAENHFFSYHAYSI